MPFIDTSVEVFCNLKQKLTELSVVHIGEQELKVHLTLPPGLSCVSGVIVRVNRLGLGDFMHKIKTPEEPVF